MAAAVIDHRTSRIPNALTFPFILLGLAPLPFRVPLAMAGLTFVVSAGMIYAIWRLGLWGGGDAKLVLALFLLASPAYPPLLYIAVLSLCLALVLFGKHVLLHRGRGPMGPSLLLAYVLSIASLGACL